MLDIKILLIIIIMIIINILVHKIYDAVKNKNTENVDEGDFQLSYLPPIYQLIAFYLDDHPKSTPEKIAKDLDISLQLCYNNIIYLAQSNIVVCNEYKEYSVATDQIKQECTTSI